MPYIDSSKKYKDELEETAPRDLTQTDTEDMSHTGSFSTFHGTHEPANALKEVEQQSKSETRRVLLLRAFVAGLLSVAALTVSYYTHQLLVKEQDNNFQDAVCFGISGCGHGHFD